METVTKKMTVTDKINDGIIRIENGKLVGLGNCTDSINIGALYELIDQTTKSEYICTITNALSGIAQIHALHSEMEEDEVSNYIKDWILPALPNYRDIYTLSKIIEFFSKA